jgi:hypothetical protein
MPRCKTRARNAIARFAAKIDDNFNDILNAPTSEKRIDAMDAMIILLRSIASSSLGLWRFRDQLCRATTSGKEGQEDVETTMALIAEIVNRHLAACTPDSVIQRPNLAN